jgi:hypothetical protein
METMCNELHESFLICEHNTCLREGFTKTAKTPSQRSAFLDKGHPSELCTLARFPWQMAR